MKRQTERTRLQISQWYLGAGQKVSNFTRMPNRPFSYLKERYGDELERLRDEKSRRGKDCSSNISEERINAIKEEIRQDVRKNRVKLLIAFALGIVGFIVIFFALKYLILILKGDILLYELINKF